MSTRLSAGLLSAAAFVVTACPALAIEPDAAAQALVAALGGGSNAKVSFESAAQDGANIVISGLSIGDSKGEDTLRFAQAVIETPSDDSDGIFDSPRIAFTDGAVSGESTGAVASAVLTDVTVVDPAEVEGDNPGQGIVFATAEATGMRFSREGKPGELTVGRVYMETDNIVDNVPQSSSGSVEDVTIPPEAFADSAVGPQTIGYENIVLDVTWDGSRNVEANTMTVDDFTLSVQDGGDLSITGIMGKLPDPTALNDADASAKAGDVEVHTITIRYDDDSLAGRIMDYMAKQQGVSREDYANQIAAALPFLLAAINNPEFQTEVAGAVGAFLKDPQSLTVKIEPAAPVSGTEIMSIVGSAPQTLPDRLNASVTANTAE